MRRGFLYLVAIIDSATRRVLSWRLSNTLTAGFCVEALGEALAQFGKPAIFNTDQGSQFTGEAFTRLLLDHRIHISMDGRGRCHDNIFVERLWWTVKYEWVYLRPASDGFEQKRSLGEFFDWYNRRRSPGKHRTRPISAPSCQPWQRQRSRWRGDAVSLWTVGCADARLTAQARSPMDKPGKTPCVSPILPTGRRLPTSLTAPQQQQGLCLIPGKVKPFDRLPALAYSSRILSKRPGPPQVFVYLKGSTGPKEVSDTWY